MRVQVYNCDGAETCITFIFLFFWKNNWFHFLLFCSYALIKVEVYELLESGNKLQKKHLIASRLLSLYTEGWEVFNVTQTVSREF